MVNLNVDPLKLINNLTTERKKSKFIIKIANVVHSQYLFKAADVTSRGLHDSFLSWKNYNELFFA